MKTDVQDKNWFHEGVMDFNDGCPRLMPNCLFNYENWPVRAKEWYAGWDHANLTNEVPE